MINFKKIQNLPLSTRKIILWMMMIIIGIGLLSLCARNFQKKIENLKTGGIKLPNFQEEFKNFPEVEKTQNQ